MKALILGSAPCVWDDFRAAINLGSFDTIYAVNQTGVTFGPIDAWITRHPENMYKWQSMRKAVGLPMPMIVAPNHNTRGHDAKIDRIFQSEWTGSSVAYAAHFAIAEGHKKVVMCGAPLDDSGNILVVGGAAGKYDHFVQSWVDHKKAGRVDNVRSMSGNTAEICGKPNKAWLNR